MRKPVLPGLLVVVTSAIMLLMAPTYAQTNTTEQELLQIRQKMARSFAEAVKNKDAAQASRSLLAGCCVFTFGPYADSSGWKGRDAETLGRHTQGGNSYRVFK